MIKVTDPMVSLQAKIPRLKMTGIILRKAAQSEGKPKAAKMAGLMTRETYGFLHHPEAVRLMEGGIGMLTEKTERDM